MFGWKKNVIRRTRSGDQEVPSLIKLLLIIKDIYFVQDRRHLYQDEFAYLCEIFVDGKYDNEQLLK